MNTLDDLKNTIGLSQGISVGRMHIRNELVRDYSPIWWCWKDDDFVFPTSS